MVSFIWFGGAYFSLMGGREKAGANFFCRTGSLERPTAHYQIFILLGRSKRLPENFQVASYHFIRQTGLHFDDNFHRFGVGSVFEHVVGLFHFAEFEAVGGQFFHRQFAGFAGFQ